MALAASAVDRVSTHCDLAESHLLAGEPEQAKRPPLAALKMAPTYERGRSCCCCAPSRRSRDAELTRLVSRAPHRSRRPAGFHRGCRARRHGDAVRFVGAFDDALQSTDVLTQRGDVPPHGVEFLMDGLEPAVHGLEPAEFGLSPEKLLPFLEREMRLLGDGRGRTSPDAGCSQNALTASMSLVTAFQIIRMTTRSVSLAGENCVASATVRKMRSTGASMLRMRVF